MKTYEISLRRYGDEKTYLDRYVENAGCGVSNTPCHEGRKVIEAVEGLCKLLVVDKINVIIEAEN